MYTESIVEDFYNVPNKLRKHKTHKTHKTHNHMKYLLLEKLDFAIQEESIAKVSYKSRYKNNVTLGEARDLYDELCDAEEATDAAQRDLLVKLSDQYYALYYEDMSYEDCIDYAERQVDKITYRIKTRVNTKLN